MFWNNILQFGILLLCLAMGAFFYNKMTVKVVQKEEQVLEEVQIKKKAVVDQSESQLSFKKLKQMAQKKSGGRGAGQDPIESSYQFCLKQTAIDVDVIPLQNQDGSESYLVIVAENQQVTAHLVQKTEKVFSTTLKLTKKVISASVSKPQSQANKFVVAIACFDQSTVLIYPLQLTESGQLKFGLEQGKLQNVHDFPIGRLRLSKTQARYLVTCGEDQDLFLKLWNLQSMTCDHKFKTGSLKHKLMVQSGQLDLYAVAGGTSEIRLYKIEQHLKQTTPNLNKVITLTSHRNEVIDIAFAGNLCVTIGQDGQIFLYQLDLTQNSYKVLGSQCTGKLDEMCKVAVGSSDDRTVVAYTTPTSEIVILDKEMNVLQRINVPHNNCQINQLFFLGSSTLASVSRLDQRVNFWTVV